MKSTRILLFILLFFFTIDAYSQLKAPPRVEGDGTGPFYCNVVESVLTSCVEFTLPLDGLTYDYSDPNEPCKPVNNFGCDLHIGYTFEGDGTTTYERITSCIVDEIIAANNYVPNLNGDGYYYPMVCIEFPIKDKFGKCKDDFVFTLDLYCKDGNGEFTPISEASSADVNNNWSLIFPGSRDYKTTISAETWSTDICCDDSHVANVPPNIGGYNPLVGQNNDGSAIYLSHFENLKSSDILIFDKNYQKINLSNTLNKISNDKYTLDISHFKAGEYFIRIKNDNTIFSSIIIRL